VFSLFSGLFSFVDFPSVLWYCWLGLLTCKNRLPYNLYCVGGDIKHCSIQYNHSTSCCVRKLSVSSLLSVYVIACRDLWRALYHRYAAVSVPELLLCGLCCQWTRGFDRSSCLWNTGRSFSPSTMPVRAPSRATPSFWWSSTISSVRQHLSSSVLLQGGCKPGTRRDFSEHGKARNHQGILCNLRENLY